MVVESLSKMNESRLLHHLIYLNGFAYAIGGYKREDNKDQSLKSCEKYDI